VVQGDSGAPYSAAQGLMISLAGRFVALRQYENRYEGQSNGDALGQL